MELDPYKFYLFGEGALIRKRAVVSLIQEIFLYKESN